MSVEKRAGDLTAGETVFWKGWRALTAVTRYDEGGQHYIVCVADDAEQFAYNDLDEPVLGAVR